MKSSSDDSDLIPQLTTDNGNRDKQKLDEEGTSSKTSSSREESNFESLRGSIDPKDKGKGVLKNNHSNFLLNLQVTSESSPSNFQFLVYTKELAIFTAQINQMENIFLS